MVKRFLDSIGCYNHFIFLGINVYYSGEVDGISPGNALLICMILLWTGDYPGQSEVGKFVRCCIHPCRRCELKGVKLVMYT